jgi:hypothetical protein
MQVKMPIRTRLSWVLAAAVIVASAGAAVAEDDESVEEPAAEKEAKLHVGGALRFNAFYKSWDAINRDKSGDMDFDTFRINADGSFKGVDLSLEYRFYSGYHMLHHGYFGYTFDGGTELQIGVSRKPFGLLPYASHNWFFDVTYYLGMEDDYDAGVKILLPSDKLDLQFAFYKNDEGSYTGDSIDSARYSYDVVHTDETELGYVGVDGPRTNEEINQFNARAAYTLTHRDNARTEVGFSGEWGQLYNSTTKDTGDHWAAALHVNGQYGRVNVMVEALAYGFRPENPAEQDDTFIVMGAYDAPYKVAAEGDIGLLNVSYTLPVEHKSLESIVFYNNYSYLRKRDSSFEDSQQNVAGMLLTAGKLLTYVDFAFGKNHPWIGSGYGAALAEGDPDAEWELRFNINIGYYF